MSDDNKTNASLGAFLTKFTAPVAGIIAFITSLYGFLKLFADKDAGLLTIISLVAGILLLLGICLYYARFWRPEKQDKSTSAFAPTLTDEQVKAQAKKETGRKRIRRAAVAGLVLVPLLTFAGFGGWQYVQTLPTKDIIILVADFEGPDPQSYRVTETIRKNLENATEPYPDTKVKLLGKVIKDTPEQSGRDLAREEGKKRKAAIVIWGWYGKTKDTVPISVNFEILKPPEYLPELGKEMRGQVQTAKIAELESFKVQTRLSNQMAYLTLMTLGMSRYAANDWDGTIDRLTNALDQIKDNQFKLGQDAVYFARAHSYQKKSDHDKAIIDYTQVLKLKPDDVHTYYNRGLSYSAKKNYDEAIADYTQALKLKPKSDWAAIYYYNRGNAYSNKQNYDNAIADYTQAVKLKPLGEAYYNRGVAYGNKQNYDNAIADYTQAIKLLPEWAATYYNRGIAYGEKQDYDRAIADYTQAIRNKPDYAQAYINRGRLYQSKQDNDKAIIDFTQAIKSRPDIAMAYYLRGLAYSNKQDYDTAIADHTQAIRLEPDAAVIYYNRGLAYGNKQDYDNATADFTQALKLKPDLAESHLWRGVIYSQRGEKQKAMADLNAARKGLDDPMLKQRAEEELRKLK